MCLSKLLKLLQYLFGWITEQSLLLEYPIPDLIYKVHIILNFIIFSEKLLGPSEKVKQNI